MTETETVKTPADVMPSLAFNPTLLAAAEALRKEAAERIRHLRAGNLLLESFAPTRHLQTNPTRTGEWGRKLEGLIGRLNDGRGMLAALVGTRGNGKTQMAVELIKHTTALGKPARFTTAVGFFIKVKGTFKKDARVTEEQVLAEFHRPRLLVIDEFEKRGDSLWENNLIFELLNQRYNSMRDTVIIANETGPDFLKYVGPSVASRMAETGGLVECTWASFR